MVSSSTSYDSSFSLHQEVMEQLERGKASKRAREVASIILERESCTTSDLEALGYKHSPRAVRDLKEAGITVETTQERYIDPDTGTTKGRARYKIVGTDPNRVSRRAFSKRTMDEVKRSGRCEICGATGRLQVDHRIPFEVGGESYPHVIDELMPLCPSCNRSKSWECEHCQNWLTRDVDICRTCMWSHPKDYAHVATKQVRELRITLEDQDLIRRFDEQRPDLNQVLKAALLAEMRLTDSPE